MRAASGHVAVVCFLTSLFALPARAVELVQYISRENPSFDVPRCRLVVGRDGQVYLASHDYVLRVSVDGKDRFGSTVTRALTNVAANRDGVMATAHAHFVHSVRVADPSFNLLGSVDDFLVNDGVGWQAPCDVQAGAGGDFFAMDPNRNRIVRVSSQGRMLTTFSLQAAGNFAKKLPRFRVWDQGQRFYILTDSGAIKILGFDGKLLGSVPSSVGGPWEDSRGGFDVDSSGRLYLIEDQSDVIEIYDSEGRPAGSIRLRMGARKGRVSDIGLTETAVVIRRPNPVELFQVYDRATGVFRRVVEADVEQMRVQYSSDTWTAGAFVPIKITFTAAGREIRPHWRVFVRPVNTPEWTERPLRDGAVQIPPDSGGLYQVKVGASVRGGSSPYEVQALVQIRQLGSAGTLSVQTPRGRIYYGRGEEIPFTITRRSTQGSQTSRDIVLSIESNGRVLMDQQIPAISSRPVQASLSKELTRIIRPGRYWVTARKTGFTSDPQLVVIGTGLERRTPFSIVQYGDYGSTFPGDSFFNAPDAVANHLERSRKLGINLFADRVGYSADSLGRVDGISEDASTMARLEKDPRGVAPDKARVENALRQAVAGYGAYGIEEQGILLGMDASLPLGSGLDPRRPQEFAEAITRVARAFKDYPAFRGWSWAANWWITARGASLAPTPATKAAYEAALKAANQHGTWDPVLDQVSQVWINYPIDAEKQFRAALNKVSSGKRSVMTGPYRQPGILPPITFQDADEVDLHFQAEQIQPPQTTAHNVDFYKRPGKRAWGHPEAPNEDGTGGMMFSNVLQMAMRGTDGVGWSGKVPYLTSGPSDNRATGPGIVSCFRTLADLLEPYGPWLPTLEHGDPIAIPVSTRMMRIDDYKGVFGRYFSRLYEAYNACLYAHRPARFVFVEDMKPDSWKGIKAILLVSQTVELDPELARGLAGAEQSGIPIYCDGTCRPELVQRFKQLDIAFTKVENDAWLWQDDSAYLRVTDYFKTHAAALETALGSNVPPVAGVIEPDILLSERKSEEARFTWVINNRMVPLEPGQMWRVGLIMCQRMPGVVDIDFGPSKFIYDMFSRQQVRTTGGKLKADLRTAPARLYARLPAALGGVELTDVRFGGRAGETLRWSFIIKDDQGNPLKARLPVSAFLTLEDNTILDHQYASAGPNGIDGRFVVPIGLFGTDVPQSKRKIRLVVSELITGAQDSFILDVNDTGGANLGPWTVVSNGESEPQSKSATGYEGVQTEARPVLQAPPDTLFGPHLKDVAIASDGKLAVINAMNWGDNLFGVDLETGQTRWSRRIGHHFAYGPTPAGKGTAVQGYDLTTAEGYHLNLLDALGQPERKFALFGLPKRATFWFVGSMLLDRINHFAIAPDGSWVASAGDLGLAVWNREGKLLWSQDWWKTTRKRTPLVAQDNETLIVLDGTTVGAYRAIDGQLRWQLSLARNGTLTEALPGPDGRKLVVRGDIEGGRIFILEAGMLVNTLHTKADAMAWSADGRHLAATAGVELHWFDVAGGLEWTFQGDDTLRSPRVSPDGKYLAVGSELGTLFLLSADGVLKQERDMRTLPVPAWMPGSDLVVATWMGALTRFQIAASGEMTVRWQTRVQSPDNLSDRNFVQAETIPITRRTGWGNASSTPAPLTPNLLNETAVLVEAWYTNPFALRLKQGTGLLHDGKPDAPPGPWLDWPDVNYIDSGWRDGFALEFNAFNTQLQLQGITLAEDPRHPESWLRDMRLQFWDPAGERWHDGPYLLSDSAVHTHHFDKPLEASRFRLVTTGGGTWPAGNLRLGEVVLHGRSLGCSHPDALAKKPVAVLFDEGDAQLKDLITPGMSSYRFGSSYSGGRHFALERAGLVLPGHRPPFGHAIPDWNFEIAEKPEPGQYRWLQFAWKALTPETTGMSMLLARPWPGEGCSICAGSIRWPEGIQAVKKVADKPPLEWQVVRVDLWELFKRPLRIQCLGLQSVGGGAAFDQILLARSAEDLAAVQPSN